MTQEKESTSKDATQKQDKPVDKKLIKEGFEEELSEEDQELKSNLELMVERLADPQVGVQKLAVESMRKEIKTATSTMTSVPKPLKFLREHYDNLKELYETKSAADVKPLLADVVSILATTCAKDTDRETLKYRMLGTNSDPGEWGHEYIRHLTGEIAAEYQELQSNDQPVAALKKLIIAIVPYLLTHNAEPEAVDLLLELDLLHMLEDFVDARHYQRTCHYLVSCCNYLPEPEDTIVLNVAYNIYMRQAQHPDAMRVALKMNNKGCIQNTFKTTTDPLVKQQLGYLMARQGVVENLEEGPCAIEDDEFRDRIYKIMSNSNLSPQYLELARDLDVLEPKEPEDVYKQHLVEGRTPAGQIVDSARQNLANTFVNAFVNAGFGQDKLVTVSQQEGEQQTHWIFKNKDHGRISATASIGMITMWDVDGGLPQVDKYLYSQYSHVVSGALLAVGVVNCCVQNECDPAYALLYEKVESADKSEKIGAIMGLGLAYAGTGYEACQDLLVPVVSDPEVEIEVAAFAAISLGLIFISSCQEDCTTAILQALMMRGEGDMASPFAQFLCLGLGLLFLGTQETAEATLEVTKTLNEKISKYAQVCLDSLAYAGTGDVLKVQELVSLCGEHPQAADGNSFKAAHQGPATVGIALIAMAEGNGVHMATRMLEHLLQFGDPTVRRAVPLAVALLYPSNPELYACDTLSRLSHDTDSEVASNAVLSLGIIGAGTNNARLAGMLRSLTAYYYKDPTMLFLVRIAQGLVHMGKGLLTLNPYHTDRQLLSGVATAGILAVVYSCFSIKDMICDQYHYILYYLATAMKPRMLMTVDEQGELLPVPVRVGQAVDVVAQAGRPKTITGFQTHTSPVLLGAGERAELATEKYVPVGSVLEGTVILKPNPDYVDANE